MKNHCYNFSWTSGSLIIAAIFCLIIYFFTTLNLRFLLTTARVATDKIAMSENVPAVLFPVVYGLVVVADVVVFPTLLSSFAV